MVATGSGKNPRYDNSTTPEQPQTTPTTTIDAEETTARTEPTLNQSKPTTGSTDQTDEMRIDQTGPSIRATTLPPSTRDRNNSRRPTTRIDTTLEMGEYPTERTFTTPTAATTSAADKLPSSKAPPDDSQTSTSLAHPVTVTTMTTTMMIESTTDAMLIETLPPRPRLPEPSQVLQRCNSSADCSAPAKCVAQRCLTPCTTTNTLNNTTTTSNTDNCFQGIATFCVGWRGPAIAHTVHSLIDCFVHNDFMRDLFFAICFLAVLGFRKFTGKIDSFICTYFKNSN